MTTPLPLTIAYTPEYLDWQLDSKHGHPSNPIRAALAVELLLNDLGYPQVQVVRPRLNVRAVRHLASQVHDRSYVNCVLRGFSQEWPGRDERLGHVAALMFQGTALLTKRLLAAPAQVPAVYFNPQGAKHHAQRNYSSGFCVLNDFAWAARTLAGQGRRPFYLDWDVHHGDGVENLLRDTPIPTASIHGDGFPGTGTHGHDPANAVYNWLLPPHSGDETLLAAVFEALGLATEHGADTLLLAAGADGLLNDPLGNLNYSLEGIELAAQLVGDWAARTNASVLIGGAGGYLPLTETPQAWARTVAAIQRALNPAAQPREAAV